MESMSKETLKSNMRYNEEPQSSVRQNIGNRDTSITEYVTESPLYYEIVTHSQASSYFSD